MPLFPPDMIGQIIANLAGASLIYYFMKQQVASLTATIAKLEAENKRLGDQHEDDMQKLIRRRNTDTRPLPDIPPDEVQKFKDRTK